MTWRAHLRRDLKRLWPKPRAKTQRSIPQTATLATKSLMERWRPLTSGSEQFLIDFHLFCKFVHTIFELVCNSDTEPYLFKCHLDAIFKFLFALNFSCTFIYFCFLDYIKGVTFDASLHGFAFNSLGST